MAREKTRVSPADYDYFEFHRHVTGLLPLPGDPRPGLAVIVADRTQSREKRTCTCSGLSQSDCPHVRRLAAIRDSYAASVSCSSLEEDFRDSIWYRIAACLGEQDATRFDSVIFGQSGHGNGKRLLVKAGNGNKLLLYSGNGPDSRRLYERCRVTVSENEIPHRGSLLHRLTHLAFTETEKALRERHMESRRCALEATFWHRFAYHCYREFGRDGFEFRPSVNHQTGEFMLSCVKDLDVSLFHIYVPRKAVREMLSTLKKYISNQHQLPLHPVPLKTIFKISRKTELDLDIRPQIQLIQEQGEKQFFERENLDKFRYGDLVYIRELGILARLEPPGSKKRFRSPVRTTLKKHQIPAFMEELAQDSYREFILEESAADLRIIKDTGGLEISPDAIDREWCWLSGEYRLGDESISLAEILAARSRGQRFIGTRAGWFDCSSCPLETVDRIFEKKLAERLDERGGRLKISRTELLRLCAMEKGRLFNPAGQETKKTNSLLRQFLEPAQTENILPPQGLTSPLRNYQLTGVNWAFNLFQNGLGGLLCDDMGLGKTHQVMGLLLLLMEREMARGPFLVVCPATVLGHWEQKLKIHAPSLKPLTYYGPERSLKKDLRAGDIILTSYGILWRDIARLEKINVALAVFDEIQHIKNPATKAYSAAVALSADQKLGLTGTPIENSLSELKALVDLVLPGYLGSDKAFNDYYIKCDHEKLIRSRREELGRLVTPVVLRRLKRTVLDELPEKIEDIMTCHLSDQQVKLYQDAVAARAPRLVDALSDDNSPVPYIHIFSLLDILKQTCDHPALVLKKPDAYREYRSGKWDLFKELLGASLDSGRKVVVFTQYLGMIDIMKHHLEKEAVDFATLTGSSTRRKDIITRFNEDPDCRVMVASLKAGGVGIDLISASVVIHYDRWWNAAREDQATDRVHRIGQKKVVQVFKLVSSGTLEEKISAIIERKRNLMEEVIKEDDGEILKALSREDMLAMISAGAQIS